MENKYIWLGVGILIGWITKFPLILKWYKEIKLTKDYQIMRLEEDRKKTIYK